MAISIAGLALAWLLAACERVTQVVTGRAGYLALVAEALRHPLDRRSGSG